ncbi:hypothetical protein RhiirA5_504889 [Rhizophagus irregularis]|uniref:Crinkler effector protein N-terminal domain-containing protein n=1 Tax=Rhizophagus irregularis TaxID=588596 RepID=A0A2N0R3U1_9GLOM|nr:hypothetical protein RhiirA5_504889 [Rhizophagus irregularis]PKC57969.1 hypothetical protein RhiirA1_541341 [Rhizophagus irregularis]
MSPLQITMSVASAESKQNEFDLDDEDINIIEKNKVAGQVFITLTEEKLLAPPYNLLGGPAGAIELLIKELICKVQVTESLHELEKSEKRSFQEKNDLQTAEATYANEPQNHISTSEESFQEINLQPVEATNSQNPISTSEESFQEINLQPAVATNSQNPIRFLSSKINIHLPENASQKLRYYELWNKHYSKWPSLNEFTNHLHNVSKDHAHSSFKREIAVLKKLFAEEHPAQLRLAHLEGQLKVISEGISCLVAFYHFGEKKWDETDATNFNEGSKKKNSKTRGYEKRIEILSTKKDAVKKELEVAQDSVILGAYHRINDHYNNYHKASTLLLKRKLFENAGHFFAQVSLPYVKSETRQYESQIIALSINNLKSAPGTLATDVQVPKVDPCLLYGEELLSNSSDPIKEFTLASCGHIFHQKCLEKNLVSGEVICPNKECNKAIETFLSPDLFKEGKGGGLQKSTKASADETNITTTEMVNTTASTDATAIQIDSENQLPWMTIMIHRNRGVFRNDHLTIGNIAMISHEMMFESFIRHAKESPINVINGNTSDHIDDLKEKIYEEVKKKHNDFLDIEAEDLRLWKVEINNSSDDEFSSLVLKNDNTKNITKLRGTIREFWDDDEKRPKVGCTHIIVDSLRLVERRKMDNHIQDQGEGLNLLIGQLREMGLQNPEHQDLDNHKIFEKTLRFCCALLTNGQAWLQEIVIR